MQFVQFTFCNTSSHNFISTGYCFSCPGGNITIFDCYILSINCLQKKKMKKINNILFIVEKKNDTKAALINVRSEMEIKDPETSINCKK